jgi:hypothetical protein
LFWVRGGGGSRRPSDQFGRLADWKGRLAAIVRAGAPRGIAQPLQNRACSLCQRCDRQQILRAFDIE